MNSSFSQNLFFFLRNKRLYVCSLLHVQSSGIGPTVSKLASVEDQYRHLATAVDATRHHMATKGIYLSAGGTQEYTGETSFSYLAVSNTVIVVIIN